MDLLDEFEILDEDNCLNICPYCGGISDSPDPNMLCPECREIFGHNYIFEL